MDAAWLLLPLVGLLAVALLIAAVAGWRTHRRHQRPAAAAQDRLADPVAHQAWTAAYGAHVRLARLEAGVRDLEQVTTGTTSRDPGDGARR
jgi:hypothetical protein